MKKLITILVFITLLTGCGNNQFDKDYPTVPGTRLEVNDHYFKKYGMHTNQWKPEVRKAYDRDMDKAEAK